MQGWTPLRGCVHDPAFLADAEAAGISPQDLDELIRVNIEDVLCGASEAKLNVTFPVVIAPDIRFLRTNNHVQVPSLRIAWRIADDDGDKIQLLRCSLVPPKVPVPVPTPPAP